MADASAFYDKREAELGSEVMRDVERQVMLRIIDQRWREHLEEMDYLQEGINLRAMGQIDPLIEWQREGFEMFGADDEGHRPGLRPLRDARPGGPPGGARAAGAERAADVQRRLAQRRLRQPPRRLPRPPARSPRRSPPPPAVARRPRRPSSAGQAADGRQGRVVEDAAQRAVPVRQRQEVQAVPRATGCDAAGADVMRDFTDDLKELRRRLGEAHGYLKIDANRARLERARARGRPARPVGRPGAGQEGQRRVRQRARRRRHLRRALPSSSTTSSCSTRWPARSTTSRRSPTSTRPSPRSAPRSTSSTCAACSPASTTRPTASSRSTPRTAASTPRTGARSSCGCTAAGPSDASSASRSTASARAPRPGSSPPSSPSPGATPTA